MNMSNPGGTPAGISPDEWERIARYVTGEAGPGEIEITMRWVEADTHRAEVVRLLQSIDEALLALSNICGAWIVRSVRKPKRYVTAVETFRNLNAVECVLHGA